MNYESRFAALLSRFNSHCFSPSLPEPVVSFTLMASANIEGNCRVSMLAAASSGMSFKAKNKKSHSSDDLVNKAT